MVNLYVIVEGGTQDANAGDETFNNVESLRESLHRLFSRLLGSDEIDVTVEMGAGYRNAAKIFLKDVESQHLFVDSDSQQTDEWYVRLQSEKPDSPIIIPDEAKDKVYFMIQEMEAWFLKQPECLERWGVEQGYVRKHPEKSIAADDQISGKDVESLPKPSRIVGVIVQRYFDRILDGGSKKKVKYGKLKSAPSIIDQIDVHKLATLDKELYRFKISF